MTHNVSHILTVVILGLGTLTSYVSSRAALLAGSSVRIVRPTVCSTNETIIVIDVRRRCSLAIFVSWAFVRLLTPRTIFHNLCKLQRLSLERTICSIEKGNRAD